MRCNNVLVSSSLLQATDRGGCGRMDEWARNESSGKTFWACAGGTSNAERPYFCMNFVLSSLARHCKSFARASNQGKEFGYISQRLPHLPGFPILQPSRKYKSAKLHVSIVDPMTLYDPVQADYIEDIIHRNGSSICRVGRIFVTFKLIPVFFPSSHTSLFIFLRNKLLSTSMPDAYAYCSS